MILSEIFDDEYFEEGFGDFIKAGALGLGIAGASIPSAQAQDISKVKIEKSPVYVSNFFRTIYPVINQTNIEIKKDRTKLLYIMSKHQITDEENIWLKTKMAEYKAKDINDLKNRIDVVPASLAMAQAAIESQWGKSELSKANNVFGQKASRGSITIGNDGSQYSAFDDIASGVKSYMMNINTHPAYENLRNIRHTERVRNKPISGESLANGLKKYSSRAGDYVKQVKNFIKQYNLKSLDS